MNLPQKRSHIRRAGTRTRSPFRALHCKFVGMCEKVIEMRRTIRRNSTEFICSSPQFTIDPLIFPFPNLITLSCYPTLSFSSHLCLHNKQVTITFSPLPLSVNNVFDSRCLFLSITLLAAATIIPELR